MDDHHFGPYLLHSDSKSIDNLHDNTDLSETQMSGHELLSEHTYPGEDSTHVHIDSINMDDHFADAEHLGRHEEQAVLPDDVLLENVSATDLYLWTGNAILTEEEKEAERKKEMELEREKQQTLDELEGKSASDVLLEDI